MIEIPTIIRARALVIHQGKILMMKRIKDGFEYYTLLGGKVEGGETPEQGCIREVMEESGVIVTVLCELHRDHDIYNGSHNTNIIYACDYVSGVPVLSGEERDRHSAANYYEPLWVALKDISALTIKPDWMAGFLRTL